MIELPVEQLLNTASTETANMNGWSQKMRDTFHAMGGRAREAGKIVYHKASESYSRVASAVRPQGTWLSYFIVMPPQLCLAVPSGQCFPAMQRMIVSSETDNQKQADSQQKYFKHHGNDHSVHV
jgi:hypothetical protein